MGGPGTGQVSMCFLGFGDLAVSWAAALRDPDWITVSAYLPATLRVAAIQVGMIA